MKRVNFKSNIMCLLSRYEFRFFMAVFFISLISVSVYAAKMPFQLEEASIEEMHTAIQKRQVTCQQVVQTYIDRARAYNGVCTQLVTQDGASISSAPGIVRATKPLVFPTTTVAINSILPDVANYRGLPY